MAFHTVQFTYPRSDPPPCGRAASLYLDRRLALAGAIQAVWPPRRSIIKSAACSISMDKIFVERLWWNFDT